MSDGGILQAAERQAATAKAEKKVARARVVLLFGETPETTFYAPLAMRLRVVFTYEIERMGTDGKSLICNPDFVNTLTENELVAVVIHECLHCVLGHHVRMQNRHAKLWNIAADMAVNPLIDAGPYKLPGDVVRPDSAGLADDQNAEFYYRELQKMAEQQRDELGDKFGDGAGAVMPPRDGKGQATEQAAQNSEAEWQQAAKHAAAKARDAARQRGQQLGGFLGDLVGEIEEPKLDWRALLREFLSEIGQNDFSWSMPSRRSRALGIYLPTLRSVELGGLVVAVDESGSMSDELLREIWSEIAGVIQLTPISVTILRHTTEVLAIEHWTPCDPDPDFSQRYSGGTSHRDVFAKIEEHDMQPACFIGCSDMWSDWPEDAPQFPCLWLTPKDAPDAPFGHRVEL